jgi:hypothetical protein
MLEYLFCSKLFGIAVLCMRLSIMLASEIKISVFMLNCLLDLELIPG